MSMHASWCGSPPPRVLQIPTAPTMTFPAPSPACLHDCQGYRKRHMNVLGPAVGPTTANGVVTAFLLGQQ
jgi:hypothetical protein